MDLNPYSPCPCGSGKQFKWCCQPIHRQISQVFELDENGQHETALKLMDDVVKQNPGNAEAYGRKALLLFQNDRGAEAETTLDEALRINANYAFGYFLKARFRLYEGEIAGGLLLLRKAAELYSPEAHDILAAVLVEIFDCEMKLNRPLAAHAAGEMALKHEPGNENLRKGMAEIFSESNPNFPKLVWRTYEYKPLAATASADRKKAWQEALASANTGRLGHAENAFAQLVTQDENDAAAWYNLALTRAWLGKNADALEALDRYVAVEPNDAEAAEAWALAEVLRVGQGMEDMADFVEHSIVVQLRDPQAAVAALGELEHQRLLAAVQVSQEQGMLTAALLDPPPPALTPELEAKQSPRLGAYLLLARDLLRMWNVNKAALERSFAMLQKRAGAAFGNQASARGPAKFHDIVSEALVFPRNAVSQEDATHRLEEGIARFFEEEWLHRPLKSLGGVAPIDAAGHATLKKKLVGAVTFIAECASLSKYPYDFDRLRRKLGLSSLGQSDLGLIEPALAEGAAPTAATPDIAAMGAAELATLPVETLDDAHLETAYQTAQKLDARELAGQFARTLIGRSPRPDRPDRYPLFNHLIQLALGAGDTTAAMDDLNAGEQDDCTHNEGRRRNDYELRRAQLHAKRGEHDQAQDVFDRLIERVPSEMRYRASAAEAMLSARQGSRALHFAEAGLAEARKQNNRDAESEFLYLVDAAKKGK